MMHSVSVESHSAASAVMLNSAQRTSIAMQPLQAGSSTGMRDDWLWRAFEAHRSELYSYILRKMGSPEEAEELTQDVFVRLLRYRNLETINNLQAFLFTTANNIVRDRIRRLHARCHNFHDDIDELEVDAGLSLERCLEGEQCASLLECALGELQEEYRRALILHRLEKWTHAQIASELDTTVGVVRRYISAALEYCHQKVESDTSSSVLSYLQGR